MDVEKPTAVVQLLVAWRANRWVLSVNAVEVGVYAYRAHAIDAARTRSAEAWSQDKECYLLIREKDGSWREQRCPKPRRHMVAPRPPKA